MDQGLHLCIYILSFTIYRILIRAFCSIQFHTPLRCTWRYTISFRFVSTLGVSACTSLGRVLISSLIRYSDTTDLSVSVIQYMNVHIDHPPSQISLFTPYSIFA
jgi:hypothetical protein